MEYGTTYNYTSALCLQRQTVHTNTTENLLTCGLCKNSSNTVNQLMFPNDLIMLIFTFKSKETVIEKKSESLTMAKINGDVSRYWYIHNVSSITSLIYTQ